MAGRPQSPDSPHGPGSGAPRPGNSNHTPHHRVAVLSNLSRVEGPTRLDAEKEEQRTNSRAAVPTRWTDARGGALAPCPRHLRVDVPSTCRRRAVDVPFDSKPETDVQWTAPPRRIQSTSPINQCVLNQAGADSTGRPIGTCACDAGYGGRFATALPRTTDEVRRSAVGTAQQVVNLMIAVLVYT